EPRYVQSLADAGFEPYGQSRWFNRVAVRVAPERIAALAELPFVRRLALVEQALPRPRVPAGPAESTPASPPAAEPRPLPARALSASGQPLTQLARLGTPAVHDSGYVGTGVNVCMLDDGFNWYRRHEALRDIQVPAGWTRDFIRGGDDVQDTVAKPSQ